MRTLAMVIALLALAPSASRADESDPPRDEEEARLQELERILAETEGKAAESKPESGSESESGSGSESGSEFESDSESESDSGSESESVSGSGSESDCPPLPVVFHRRGVPDPVVTRLTDDHGVPSPAALSALSLLAQPPAPKDAAEPAPEPMQLNPGLLLRLQRIAARFPGRTINVVSGYRPKARSGSRHRSGDALDIHVDGVEDLALAEFARTLEGTGVGYYPNSTFVHIDVRGDSTYWVDRSEPGQPPDYGPWPAADGVAEAAVQAKRENEYEYENEHEKEKEQEQERDRGQAPADTLAEPSLQLDPELQALSERAVLVMNLALAGDRS